jgi:ABC-type lipoprotein export system ATPase subunit
MITATELSYGYAYGNMLHYPAVQVDKGASLVILGKSGCGKTTLLHMLGGLLRPHKGSVHIHGKDMSSLSEKALDKFRGQHIGFIFQKSYFIQSLSVKDNILLAPYVSNKQVETGRLKSLSEALGIAHLLHKLPANLSQGEQQRVSIARAIIHKPDLVLADEPTSSLDDDNTETVSGLLQDLCRQNDAALIIVTHDIRLKQLIPNQISLS